MLHQEYITLDSFWTVGRTLVFFSNSSLLIPKPSLVAVLETCWSYETFSMQTFNFPHRQLLVNSLLLALAASTLIPPPPQYKHFY